MLNVCNTLYVKFINKFIIRSNLNNPAPLISHCTTAADILYINMCFVLYTKLLL